MNKVALALLAHPDDAEFLCGGTLWRLALERGWQIHVATMTAGDCGSAEHSSEEISRIRRAEAEAAALMLNGHYHCVGCKDLNVFHDAATQAAVTRLLRQVQPDLVFTHSPDDYHLDHEATSRIVRAAVFAAPVPLYLPGEKLPATDRIAHQYYCDPIEGKDIFGCEVAPTTVIDISSVIEHKTAMLGCHASQRNWLLKHHGVDKYLDAMKNWSAVRGKSAGVAFAEGFRQHRGHSYPQDDWLKELLG